MSGRALLSYTVQAVLMCQAHMIAIRDEHMPNGGSMEAANMLVTKKRETGGTVMP